MSLRTGKMSCGPPVLLVPFDRWHLKVKLSLGFVGLTYCIATRPSMLPKAKPTGWGFAVAAFRSTNMLTHRCCKMITSQYFTFTVSACLTSVYNKQAVTLCHHQGRPTSLSKWCILHISSLSAKFIHLPLIFVLFRFLGLSYFDHDAFTHHA